MWHLRLGPLTVTPHLVQDEKMCMPVRSLKPCKSLLIHTSNLLQMDPELCCLKICFSLALTGIVKINQNGSIEGEWICKDHCGGAHGNSYFCLVLDLPICQ